MKASSADSDDLSQFILFLIICSLKSGEVSIKIEFEPLLIIAEHLLLLFFLLLLLHFPQKPSILGTPTELPHPKIINLDFIAI